MDIKKELYFKDTEELQLSAADTLLIPTYVALAYLFNPYAVLNCVGMTTTVWSNFFLAAFFFSLSHRNVLLSCLFLALETQRNFYPFVLIVPCVLILSDDRSGRAGRIGKGASVCFVYVAMLLAGFYFGIVVIKNSSFLRATYGFMLVFL